VNTSWLKFAPAALLSVIAATGSCRYRHTLAGKLVVAVYAMLENFINTFKNVYGSKIYYWGLIVENRHI